jgi:hypothetical protein
MVEVFPGWVSRMMSDREAAYLLFEACRGMKHKDAFPWRKLGSVDKLWREEENRTSWTLLKCFSKVVGTCPPLKQMDMLYRFVSHLPVKEALRIPV